MTSSSRGPLVAIWSSNIASPSCPQEDFSSLALACSDDKVLMSVYTAKVCDKLNMSSKKMLADFIILLSFVTKEIVFIFVF